MHLPLHVRVRENLIDLLLLGGGGVGGTAHREMDRVSNRPKSVRESQSRAHSVTVVVVARLLTRSLDDSSKRRLTYLKLLKSDLLLLLLLLLLLRQQPKIVAAALTGELSVSADYVDDDVIDTTQSA